MSLQHAAKHLEKHGRNGDTMLVHMSKGEVKSLNDLAMANGGYLTINPHTGLPEAGFLRKILPMVAGAALTGISMGAINPITAGLIVGGGTAVATGDIKEGLSAGLGAYGGAGMYSGAVTAGATTPVNPAATPVVSQPPVSLGPDATSVPLTQTSARPPVSTQRSVHFDVPGAHKVTNSVPAGTTTVKPIPHAARASEFIPGNTPANHYSSDITRDAQYKLAEQGVADVFQPGGGTKLYEALDKTPYTLGAKTTLAAAATPAAYEMYQEQQEKNKPEPGDSDPGQQYTYEANAAIPTPDADPLGREKKYFNQQYVARAAEGGITGSGNLDLHIPLDLGGEGYGGGGGNGGGAYPFQNNSGFTGNNNAPQDQAQRLAQQAHDQAQRMQPYQASSTPNSNPSLVSATRGLGASQGPLYAAGPPPEPQDLSSMKGTTFGGNPQQGMSQLMGLLGGQGMAGGGMAEGGFARGMLERLVGEGGVGQGGVPAGYSYDADTQQYTKLATGGISDAAYNLGGYSDGGRLLRGPGDGVSDSIPAVIGKKQPARLADGEFVVPARIVSELGNGSTEAGARKLYAMMDRIQKARGKTVGKGKVAKNSRAEKYLPA